MSTIAKALITLSVVAWVAGCSAPPTARVDAAKARVAGLAAEARTYAPAAYAEAQQLVARLDAELAEQAGGFSAFRTYGTTNELVSAVEASAEKLATAIEAGKQRLSGETARLAGETQQGLSEVRQSLDALSGVRHPPEQASGWQTELAAAEASLEEAGRLRASGQHAEAQQALRRASEAANRVRTSIAGHEAEVMEAQEAAAARRARGDVTIPSSVLVDGKPLPAGTYRLERRDEGPPSEGMSRGRWIEFVRNGKVAGRALAVVVPDADIGQIAATPGPRNEVRVDHLKGGEYTRIWLNRQGVNYLIHMPKP